MCCETAPDVYQEADPVLITTANDIPGYTIDEVYGEVFGLTVRSRNVGSQIGAGLKSLLGGTIATWMTASIAGMFVN